MKREVIRLVPEHKTRTLVDTTVGFMLGLIAFGLILVLL